MLLWKKSCHKHSHRAAVVHIQVPLGYLHVNVELLDHKVHEYLNQVDKSKWFSKAVDPNYIYNSNGSTPSPIYVIVILLIPFFSIELVVLSLLIYRNFWKTILHTIFLLHVLQKSSHTPWFAFSVLIVAFEEQKIFTLI